MAGVIKSDLNRAVEGIVSAGRNLIAAKADVKHGEWLPMLKKIGISQQWANKLMLISENGAIANHANKSDLPAAITALYELSRLPPEDIEDGISSGVITPDMTIRDAKGLVERRNATVTLIRREPVPDVPELDHVS
ncbi:DUF3102 domain-containing protein [Mycobacteroides chelonae]|nr:DUF3102 domain-containing protein [Mycobacteroides chelonae]